MRFCLFLSLTFSALAFGAPDRALPTCEEFESEGTFVQPDEAAMAARFPRPLFERTIVKAEAEAPQTTHFGDTLYTVTVTLARPLTNAHGLGKMVVDGQAICFQVSPDAKTPYLTTTSKLRLNYNVPTGVAAPTPEALFRTVPQLIVLYLKG